MRLLFCSSIYNMEDYAHLTARSAVTLSLADHNLNRNLISGLEETTEKTINLINNTQIPSFPHYPKIFFRRQIWSHTEGAKDINCGFINLPVLKHLSRTVTTFAALRQAVCETEESLCILTYDLHFGISLALRLAKRLFPSVHICAVLPDIPNMVILASNHGKNMLKGRLRAAVKMSFIRQFDSYVLLTEQMRELPVFAGKPSVIVEGIYKNHQPTVLSRESGKKVILYTGQLNPAYGIETLLRAFEALYRVDQNYELWICGSGGLENYIRNMAKKCRGLQYFGYVGPEAIRTYQAQATVLVNPRQNNDTFSKYAFPSKTMEYLASGRPVVGYKLDGIPAEYDDYIQYVSGNSTGDLRDKLVEICELPQEARDEIGKKGREFILRKKNPKVQCEKIMGMLHEMLKEKA